MAHCPVDSGRTIFKVIVSEDDKDGVLSLLALHEDSIATEELESLYGVLGENDDTCGKFISTRASTHHHQATHYYHRC